MRRGSSTVVSLVGPADEPLLAAVDRPANVSVVPAVGEGLEAAVSALAEAARRSAPYVLVAADPLREAADAWRAMWDVRGEDAHAGGTGFEQRAGEVLAAWRSRRFDLPDFYLVLADQHVTPGEPHPRDLHLGVLASARPWRVVPIPASGPDAAAEILRALSHLPSGPWWPDLDRLLEAARGFYPGRLVGGTAS